MLLLHNYINLYTCQKQSKQMLSILKKYSEKTDIIVDATAGMGGNSTHFCQYYSYVYALDNSNDCIKYLDKNLINYNNKIILNFDCLDILKIIKTDIIFFDPPWGGKEYKNYKNVELYISDIKINEIIENYYKHCKLIALKAPNNYLIKESKFWKIKEYPIYKYENKINFKLLIYYK